MFSTEVRTMIILKCKMCGGNLNIQEDQTVCTCEYCGTTQTIPHIDSDKKARLFNRANDYRLNNDFDHAFNAYEIITSEDPEESEAYWGLVLSEYGVEYVDDPKTGKKVPTCHRTLLKSVLENRNYLKALEYADAEKKMMYEEEAELLDSIQKKIISVSTKEEPYDIFICYKETDEDGNRTEDSVLAEDIYNQLFDSGYKVFFSRISLEDKIGKNYEPYIFSALNSSKVMLLVSTNSINCNSVWVKNEWKRFLGFQKEDHEKVLIPVCKNMSVYELPSELQKLQVQDMNKLGSMQDLLRGISKLVDNKQTEYSLNKEEKDLLEELRRSQKNNSRFRKVSLAFITTFFFSVFVFFVFIEKESLINYSIVFFHSILFFAFAFAIDYIALMIRFLYGRNKISSVLYVIAFLLAGSFSIIYSSFGNKLTIHHILFLVALFILPELSQFISFVQKKERNLVLVALPIIVMVISLFANYSWKRFYKINDSSKDRVYISKYTVGYINPDSNSFPVSDCYKGEIIDIVGKTEKEGNLYYLLKKNQIFAIPFYVRYISSSNSAVSPVQILEPQEERSIIINEDYINIRNIPTTSNSDIIGKVEKGEKYVVLRTVSRQAEPWYLISTDEIAGYIYGGDSYVIE